MPRPGTAIFHPAWETHHRPTAAAQCTSTCVITQPSTAAATFDTGTGRSTRPAAATVYTGPCRVQHLTQRKEGVEFAGANLAVAQYEVELPITAGVIPDIDAEAVVTITAASDPSLTGARLRVVEVARGSLLWQRSLTCVLDEAAG